MPQMRFTKKLLPVLILIILQFASSPARSEGEDAVRTVVSRMQSLNSFRATLTISSPQGNLRGVLSFQNGKLNLQLGDGRVIASNGRQLFVFSGTVLGRQDMVPGGGGLGWILSGFKIRVTGRTAYLTPENPASRFHDVRLTWDENFYLKQLSIRRGEETEPMTIALADIRKVENFPASLFSYKSPPGSRTVENPLNQSN